MVDKMKTRGRLSILAALTLVLLIGCSSGGGRSLPIMPDETVSNQELTGNAGVATVTEENSHYLLMYNMIYVDSDHPDGPKVEVVPVRAGEIHLNILKFLEDGPCFDCFKIAGLNFPEPGVLDVDIQIDHPFDDMDFSVFDVRGIMMFNGSHEFPVSGKSTSDPFMGDGALLNADGYTALYNGNTIDAPTGDLQKYFPGNFATATIPNSEINGYRYYANDNPLNNCQAFFGGSSDVRTFSLKLPAGQFVLGYAVDASFWNPVNTPVTDPCSDFDVNAHCTEPWKVVVTEEPTDEGVTKLLIDVYDWQGETFKMPLVECPELFDGELTATWLQDGLDYARYEVTIANEKLASPGHYMCLIRVEANENDPIGKPWLDLTAYQLHMLTVELDLEGIFVATWGDDSNPGTSSLPVARLSVGLQKAYSGGIDTVYIAINTSIDPYIEDGTISLVDGVNIYGACDPMNGWQQKPDPARSIVNFTSQNNHGALYGEFIFSDTLISQLEINAADGTHETAPNSCCAYLKTCSENLQFLNCNFKSGNGADGVPGDDGVSGEDGEPGSDGEPGCAYDPDGYWDAGHACNCEEPLPGIGGSGPEGYSGGNGGTPGYFDIDDGGVGNDGEDGGSGGEGGGFGEDGEDGMGSPEVDLDGDEGNPGLGGDGTGSVIDDVWIGSPGQIGEPGSHGIGGGGGGGGGGGHTDWINVLFFNWQDCNTYGGAGGGGGQGGLGGNPGHGGHSAGGSFCVFLSESNPEFTGWKFLAGNAGNGGNGASGGDGGYGGNGGSAGHGGVGYSGPDEEGTRSGKGGNGGTGGKGGRGGAGGGGGGGVSFCVYKYMGSAPTLTDCFYQTGNGGNGGEPNGEDGLSGEIYPPD